VRDLCNLQLLKNVVQELELKVHTSAMKQHEGASN